MNIQDLHQKSKELLSKDEVFYALLVVCVGVASFGLGRQSQVALVSAQPSNSQTASISGPITNAAAEVTESAMPETVNETLVGSKNSDKYHLPWCSGVQRIAEANKVYFASVEEAKAAGYTPAGNCPGL